MQKPAIALGSATGTAFSDGFKRGIDMTKIAFFFISTTLLLLPIPNRWLVRRRSVTKSDAANDGT